MKKCNTILKIWYLCQRIKYKFYFGSDWVSVGIFPNIWLGLGRCESNSQNFGSIWVSVSLIRNILARFGSVWDYFGIFWVVLGRCGSN